MVIPGLIFHHTGIAVKSIDAELNHYISLFGKSKVFERIKIDSQKVNVCFIQVANQVYIELVEKASDHSVIESFIEKNINYYHMGFLTMNLDQSKADLEKIGYHTISQFRSEAFNNARCAFLYAPNQVLIELIEKL